MTFIKRADLGRPLTWDELDSNFQQVDSLVTTASTAVETATTQAQAASEFATQASQSSQDAQTAAASAGSAAEAAVAKIYSDFASSDEGKGASLVQPSPLISGAPAINLQRWLDDEVVNLRTRFGVSETATARSNTDNLQVAFDVLSAAGGGKLRLPAARSSYMFAKSVLPDVLDNYGVATYATEACIIARPKIMFTGDGIGLSVFQVEDGDGVTSCFFAESPQGGGFRDLSLRGNSSTIGNSHGIINLNTSADPIHQICRDWVLENLDIRNLGSYGIGIDNGDITNVTVSNIYISNVGADGIDTKQRGPRGRSIGLNFHNITVDGFGMRLTGQAGLDFHGCGQVTNLNVRNMGLTGQFGFRFRTLTADSAEGENARMSKATNVIIEGGSTPNSHVGILFGSPDCILQGAVVRNLFDGIQVGGNSVGTPDRSIITDVHAIDCSNYGYLIGSSVNDTTLTNTYAIGCNTGFRNQGVRTTYIRSVPVNCTTDFSTTAAAQPTERTVASGNYGMSENLTSTTRITMEPRSAVTDVEVLIKPKGSSRLALTDGSGNRRVQVDGAGIGFNGVTPVSRPTVNGAATDASTTQTLVNQLRAALINNGLAQ